MKRSQPKRDWLEARAKVEAEGACRLRSIIGDPCEGKLEAAHICGREHDQFHVGQFREPVLDHHGCDGLRFKRGHLPVYPERVVCLCSKHHRLYDAHEADILPTLETFEQVQAVIDLGSIELAWKRCAPVAYALMYGREAA